MSVSLNGTSGVTFNDATTQNTSAFYGGLGFRNRIINGAMMIDQRNAGAVVTLVSAQTYNLDRWFTSEDTDGVMTIQQSTVAPVGFNYSALLTTTTADASLGASQNVYIGQKIEGFNTADLMWGTANAQTVTLSFWVRSSLTGTFGGAIANSAFSRAYPFTYTITSANTWEQKSVTIAGDTTGTWVGATNGAGLQIFFGLGVGSSLSGTAGAWAGTGYISATGATSVVGTSGATFYITGVQLEKGSTATSFDYRPYGTELSLCQRYFYSVNATGVSLVGGSSSVANGTIVFPVTMRAAGTVTGTTINRLTNYGIQDYSGSYTFLLENNATNSQVAIKYTQASGSTWSTGVPLAINPTSQSATVTISAEL